MLRYTTDRARPGLVALSVIVKNSKPNITVEEIQDGGLRIINK